MMIAASLSQAAALDDWLEELSAHQPVALEFAETRESSLLSEPLIVRGRLRRDGARLIRETSSPRAEVHVLTERHVEIRRDDSSRRRFALHRAPELAALRELLLAVIEGDSQRLTAHFHIDWQAGGDDGWTLHLIPRDQRWLDQLSDLELSGSGHVIELLGMRLADGELITTRFIAQP